VIQGATDKLASLTKLTTARSLSFDQCACVGDDTPDAPVLRVAGVAIAVADGHRDALAVADLVTSRPGGSGAVREVCDWLLDARRRRA
jgi:3-deoxy-D-manno-octulosonate 8-phosphate phosphatase (KDO 8-P phosphatase)